MYSTSNIRKGFLLPVFVLAISGLYANSYAQRPQGRNFGFGIILFEPTGGTINYWVNNVNSIDADIGGESYFGNPRLDVDYLWHFDAFNSNIVTMFAGPGAAFGFGYPTGGYWYHVDGNVWYYRPGGTAGFGIRGLVGIDVVPTRVPLEIFFQVGPLIGLSPAFGTSFDT
ncbi:MAG TPA: hypothetical protein VFA55_04205, partial [Candidatus Kapabacteria bacterium]|nr:hypothetical protein [Candidatus Kapabacteria bacterium]